MLQMTLTKVISAFLAVLATAMSSGGAKADGKPYQFSHQGIERIAWVEDGRKDRTRASALVLALHGFRKPGEAASYHENPEKLAWEQLSRLAVNEGFIVVYPAAVKGRWNLVPGLENANSDNGSPIDDEGFLVRLIDDLVARNFADPSRLYITGISDGAIMTHRLICLADTPFAAAAPLIGAAHEAHIGNCRPKNPPALMQLHGTKDFVLPYDGWIFPTGREVSIPEVMNHWRKLHGCTGQEGKRLKDLDPEDGSTVSQIDWTGCTSEFSVRLYKVNDGRHNVPALDAPVRDDPKRKYNRDLDTFAEMWGFFSARR